MLKIKLRIKKLNKPCPTNIQLGYKLYCIKDLIMDISADKEATAGGFYTVLDFDQKGFYFLNNSGEKHRIYFNENYWFIRAKDKY